MIIFDLFTAIRVHFLSISFSMSLCPCGRAQRRCGNPCLQCMRTMLGKLGTVDTELIDKLFVTNAKLCETTQEVLDAMGGNEQHWEELPV